MNLLSLVNLWLNNVCQIKTKCYSTKNKKIYELNKASASVLSTKISDTNDIQQPNRRRGTQWSLSVVRWHLNLCVGSLLVGSAPPPPDRALALPVRLDPLEIRARTRGRPRPRVTDMEYIIAPPRAVNSRGITSEMACHEPVGRSRRPILRRTIACS